MLRLTVPAVQRDGIWFPQQAGADRRADAVWSKAASENAIHAAAASSEADPFAKYPEWILPHFSGATGRMLDAGCGYGRVSIPLLKANPGLRCVGLDASPVMLRAFQELSVEHGVRDRVEFYCGNLEPLPFADGEFDFVLSSAVLLHLPRREAASAVRGFRRVLAPRGKLVLSSSFPNALSAEGLFHLPNNLRRTKNGPVRAYLRSEVRRLLADFAHVDLEAHQLVLLPRNLGPLRLPFAGFSRKVNAWVTRHWMPRFARSGLLVNHHDAVAVKASR